MNEEEFKVFEKMEASELRLRVVALEVENRLLRAELDRARNERNKFLEKATQVILPESNLRKGVPEQKPPVQGVMPKPVSPMVR